MVRAKRTIEEGVIESESLDSSRNGNYTTYGKTRARIAIILPRGEAIRNFLHTGTLDEIARAAEVVPLSVIPNEHLRNELTERYQNCFELKLIPESKVVENLRELLDLSHGRWLWSKAAQERWLVHDHEARVSGRQVNRTIKKLIGSAAANPTGIRWLSKMERASATWFRSTDRYVRFFEQIKPTLVFNGSHVHSRVAIQAVQAAQWLGIPTAAFIFSWDNLTSQGRIIPQYDYYLVWNEAQQNQLLEIYDSISPDRVIVTGTPQFDFHFRPEFQWTRAEFCEHVGADPNRPIVLYSTGMPNHMPGEPRIVEGIAEMLRHMRSYGPPQLLVRVYPKDHSGRFEEVKQRNPDVLFPEIPWEREWLTPRVEDAYLLSNTLRYAAVGINIASTVSLELCMFDKPVINVAYNPPGVDVGPLDFRRYYDFEHYRPLVDCGAVTLAGSEEEMRDLITMALKNPQALSLKRQRLIRNMFGQRLDGYSGTRIAHCLVKIAELANQPVF